MIILIGTLRQATLMTIKEEKKTKLWVEHISPRDNGMDDLKIEELFLDGDILSELPKPGMHVEVAVRPWVSGRDIRFSASHVVGAKKPQNP